MKTTIKVAVLLAMTGLFALPANAYDFSIRLNYGNMLYFDVVDAVKRQVKVVPPSTSGSDYYASYARPAGVLSIPSVVENMGISYDVIGIGERAFSGCTDIRTVSIPASVKFIEPYAFYGCTGLKGAFVIGENIQSIGNSAFYGCAFITEVHFRAVNCTTMGGSMSMTAFGNCRSLRSIKIFEGVKVIPDYAFCGMDGLTDSIQLPSSLEQIGAYAFAYCSTIPGGLVIPDKVTSIGECAFHQCHKLSSLTLGASVSQIGGRAFYHCIGLKRVTVKAVVPPQIAVTSFSEVRSGIPFRVPCSSKKMYAESAEWSPYGPFTIHGSCSLNIVASTTDPFAGRVYGSGHYNVGDSVRLMAVCAMGYGFDGWSDGVKDNPRSFVAKENMSVQAKIRRAMTVVQKDTVYRTDTVYRRGQKVIRDTVDLVDVARPINKVSEISVDSPNKRIVWEFQKKEKVISVSLFNQLGECLYTGSGRRGNINMSRYQSGPYYVRIETDRRVLRSRFFYNAK